ncbi:hypothetical protein NT04LM_3177, partial [Listeria monocytogenes FSL F2-208]
MPHRFPIVVCLFRNIQTWSGPSDEWQDKLIRKEKPRVTN